jgi:hypothetical protein
MDGCQQPTMTLFDPNVWSGRASQENFIELVVAVCGLAVAHYATIGTGGHHVSFDQRAERATPSN